MPLTSGTRLAHYEIVGAIGAGGMGEVYRARDLKLGRDVAIKVLPDIFASDPERLARLAREAQVLASLNHQHVAHVYGSLEEPPALVMEFVDGEDLAQRLARGPIPTGEALALASQIADALEAAHDKGIIHRDLKPANIKITDEGTVKVLDFGLAKALDAAPSGAGGHPGAHELMNSPTVTSPAGMTRMGVILGTAAYMAPEQAKGKPVDRGADVWAFGAVLYEMLTGRPAFDGETVTDVLAAIVTRDPDWSALPADTPPAVTRLLRRCLDRDRRRRLSDAGEARYQIDEALAAPQTAAVSVTKTAPASRLRVWLPWTALAFALVVIAVMAWGGRSVPAPVSRYAIELPPKTTFSAELRPAVAVSADGRLVAFVGASAGANRLYLRHMDSFEAVVVSGTEGASHPVFSPDGRWLAFFAGSKLVKVATSGGAIIPIADVTDPRGLSWDVEDTLVVTPHPTGAVVRMSPSGGGVTPITTPVPEAERTHRWPQLLSGGTRLIYTIGTFDSPDNYDNATIVGRNLETGETRTLMTGAMARYFPGGYLLFARGSTVYAVGFDPATLTPKGTPVPVLQGVGGDTTSGAMHFSVTDAGAVIYMSDGGRIGNARPMMIDANGRAEPIASIPIGAYADPRLSPDGASLALSMIAGGGRDIYLYNFQRASFSRLTFGGQNITPLWSPDSAFVYYTGAAADGRGGIIYRRTSDGSRDAEPIVELPYRLYLADISADGATLYFDALTPGASRADIFKIALQKGAQPQPVVDTRFDEFLARLSPDGRWVAYTSIESGTPEVYVRPADGSGGRWQVSNTGGEEPKWSPDGRRLYYRFGSLLMSVNVDGGRAFSASTPVQVLTDVHNLRVDSGISYDVHPKTGGFVMIRPTEDAPPVTSLRLIVNWTEELKAAVGR